MKLFPLLASMTIVVLAACTADSVVVKERAADFAKVEQMRDADKLYIVDCLLPGQIRRMGRMMTFLTAKVPIKTTALDCEIRGGDYVAFDRSNYATALNLWLPAAQEGDAEAQAYVGEIFQKGLGTQPDYQSAALWFKRAAEQGNKRAQLSLGYLYEKGLGVEQDSAVAMEWYQKASGLDDKDLRYAATLQTSPDEGLLEEIKWLKAELNNSRNEARRLSGELAKTQRQLQESQQKLQRYLDERNNTQSKLDAAIGRGDNAAIADLKRKLQDAERELSSYAAQVGNLEKQYRQEVDQLNSKLQETENRANQIYSQLKKQKTEAGEIQLKLVNAEAQLAKTEQELLSAKSPVSVTPTAGDTQQLDAIERKHQDALKKIQKDLQEKENRERLMADQIASLEADKKRYEQEIQQLQKSSVTVAAAQKPVIEIIDPPFMRIRGVPTVTLRSAVKEREIIGKASSPAGMLSVLINDVKSRIDERGLFNRSIAITAQETPVRIVAVDNNGARESLEFKMTLEDPISDSQRGKDDITRLHTVSPWKGLDFGHYHALIIGNNRYQKIPSLDTPVNDARAVDRVLREKYGFKTKLLIDANRYQILSAMNEMRAKLTEKDNLLIYYAGHGELDQVNMRGHWLPVDAEADNNANWISTISITDILNAMSAKHVMVVADSCYSGAMTRSSLARLDVGMSPEKKSEWLKAMLKARSRTVMTSGGLKPVMDGGGGEHSVFAASFIKALDRNDSLLEGQELYRNVSANIVAIAAKYGIEQVPQYAPVNHAGHESGEFFFVPK
ncbi:caspase family protein [Methylotuvimicrobium sp. KM2]|uniref:caspase family protein n=1 Tax=Methylotuvimicrobium sp. KM2 TaxID=3133976 RepID=UPI003101182F